MTTSQYSATLVERPFATWRFLRKLLVAACILLITLVALEVAARIWGYPERHIYDPIYTVFDRTGDIPYIHKPNLERARARGLAVINPDSLGLRAKTVGASYGAKQANEYRIAIVGDSCTFVEGVIRTENTFAQVLEDALNRGQKAVTVKVYNFGASAYSVKEMAATLQYRMVDIQPDLVVMAIIPSDFNLAPTPVIDESGYIVDQRLSYWSPPGSMARQVIRGIHLTYVLRDIGVRWFFNPPDVGQMLAGGEIPASVYVCQAIQGSGRATRGSLCDYAASQNAAEDLGARAGSTDTRQHHAYRSVNLRERVHRGAVYGEPVRPASVASRSPSHRRNIGGLPAAQPIQKQPGAVELNGCAVFGRFLGCHQKSMARI